MSSVRIKISWRQKYYFRKDKLCILTSDITCDLYSSIENLNLIERRRKIMISLFEEKNVTYYNKIVVTWIALSLGKLFS